MATQSLTIKDGTGSIKLLAVESSSYGLIPIHQITSSTSSPIYITASSANPLPVTGTLSVDVVINDLITVTSSKANPVYISGIPTTTVAKAVVDAYDWSTAANGTFNLAIENINRKGLTIFNPGPHELYIALDSDSTAITKGFTVTNTASAPSVYSFIVYPSGTYIADPTTVSAFHGGYFISGAASNRVLVSQLS